MKSDFYLQFENKFRGNRETIASKLSIYDSLIELYVENHTEISLLDIGCGRGEWLEKCKEIIPQSLGIEQDINMINLCQNLGLNVISGDAIEVLRELHSGSQSVISIFHMIEHLGCEELNLLLDECYRVLKDDGLMIVETPSIDNLLVSSKLFYIDSTHVTHINPDRIKFELESIGFSQANYYFINGGPLQNAESRKLTRILNGVAQDLLIVACKGQSLSNLIFHNHNDWENKLSQAPTTLEAATNFDLEIEQLLKEQKESINAQKESINDQKKSINAQKESISAQKELINAQKESINAQKECINDQKECINDQKESINDQNVRINNFTLILNNQSKIIDGQSALLESINQELSLCKEKITLLENRQLTIYKILFPLIRIFRIIKKIIVFVCTNIFSFMTNYRITRSILNSKFTLFLIRIAFKLFPFDSSTFSFDKVNLALNKVKEIDIKSKNFNQKLLVNYNQSDRAKKLRTALLKRVFRKK